MSGAPTTWRIEPRWPAALAVLVLLVLIAISPGYHRLLPVWAHLVAAVAAWLPMVGVAYGADKPRWLQIERTTLKAVAVFAMATTVVTLAVLIRHMIGGTSEAGGLQLLTASVVPWNCNVLALSLLYWQFDGGGPVGRMAGKDCRADWLFPAAGTPGLVPPDWQPVFVDYLYLGFSTATLFRTTDTLPLTAKAKLLIMLESAISMVTLLVVAPWAINILGS